MRKELRAAFLDQPKAMGSLADLLLPGPATESRCHTTLQFQALPSTTVFKRKGSSVVMQIDELEVTDRAGVHWAHRTGDDLHSVQVIVCNSCCCLHRLFFTVDSMSHLLDPMHYTFWPATSRRHTCKIQHIERSLRDALLFTRPFICICAVFKPQTSDADIALVAGHEACKNSKPICISTRRTSSCMHSHRDCRRS